MELIPLLAVIGRLVSLPFLLLTYFHYLHSTKFRYLYRKFFMNYLELLMVTNIWIVWALLNNYQTDRPQYIVHIYNFIGMSNLLWTNVLCFDFWRSIKNLMPYSDNGVEKKTYIKCCIYVWLCSFLYAVVSCLNDYILISNYRIFWVVTWISFTFLILILLSNVLMMIHATIIIIEEMRKIKNLSGSNTFKNEEDYKKKLKLYFKLFMVTIFLLCAKWFWFTLDQILKKKELYQIFEYLMVGNSIQGLLIFMIFTLKKKNILALKKRVSDIFSDQTAVSELNSSENKTNKERYNISVNIEDSIEVTQPLKMSNQLNC